MVGVGWILAIILGGLAGWIAEKIMHSNMGLLMNIILGIVGRWAFSGCRMRPSSSVTNRAPS